MTTDELRIIVSDTRGRLSEHDRRIIKCAAQALDEAYEEIGMLRARLEACNERVAKLTKQLAPRPLVPVGVFSLATLHIRALPSWARF